MQLSGKLVLIVLAGSLLACDLFKKDNGHNDPVEPPEREQPQNAVANAAFGCQQQNKSDDQAELQHRYTLFEKRRQSRCRARKTESPDGSFLVRK